MPAYLTHAVMGEELYNICSNDEKLFRCGVDRNSLKTFSCGLDMAEVFKTKYNHHNYKTQEFILSMIGYIKDKNCTEDELLLSFLYGHINHFFLDVYMHPLVYYISDGLKQIGPITPHYLVEGYISSYLIKEILNKDIMSVDENFFNKGKIFDFRVRNIINYLFKSIYDEKNIILSYQFFVMLLSLVEFCCKNKFVSKETLIKIFSFDKFLNENNLTREIIINLNRDIWIHPFTGEACNYSALNLYNNALERILSVFVEVNKVLYDGKSVSSLENIFPKISYDTGVSLILGKEVKFNRKNGAL